MLIILMCTLIQKARDDLIQSTVVLYLRFRQCPSLLVLGRCRLLALGRLVHRLSYKGSWGEYLVGTDEKEKRRQGQGRMDRRNREEGEM